MTYRITAALFLVSLVAAVGCKKNPKGPIYGPHGDDVVIAGEIEDEYGLPLTGEPFDLNRQRLAEASFSPVYFGYDSFQLAPEEVVKIEQVADFMQGDRASVLIIEGHCDERGSNEYNLSLGEQRALAVRGYLVNLGIAAERIQSRSFGEERPAVSGSGEAAWRLNRRGEFALYK
jgi:peptidoglycan-associated lipoprotein